MKKIKNMTPSEVEERNKISYLEFIKDWIDQFDEKNPIDDLVAILLFQVIRRVTLAIQESLIEMGEGKIYPPEQGVKIAMEQLRKIADGMEIRLQVKH